MSPLLSAPLLRTNSAPRRRCSNRHRLRFSLHSPSRRSVASVRTRESARGPERSPSRAHLRPDLAGRTAPRSSLLTRSLLCSCLLNQRKQTINLLNAASLSLLSFPTSAVSWIFLLALSSSIRFWRGPFPALYLLFQLESVHFKLFAHRLVLLFYALSYLCSIFDSSAGKKIQENFQQQLKAN